VSEVQYSPISNDDIGEILEFTDKWIGKSYFSEAELLEILSKSRKDNLCASYKAVLNGKLAGIRLSFAPGMWITSSTKGLSTNEWKISQESVAYFKSLFVGGDFQKLGIGKTLSNKSMETLTKMGAKAIICHSWLESPNNSSQRYLKSFGFESVNEYEAFWSDIDYDCTRCSPSRCSCNAAEMIKYL
jgi:ribosomal protein S18 acetylase RimI-like enzyme